MQNLSINVYTNIVMNITFIGYLDDAMDEGKAAAAAAAEKKRIFAKCINYLHFKIQVILRTMLRFA